MKRFIGTSFLILVLILAVAALASCVKTEETPGGTTAAVTTAAVTTEKPAKYTIRLSVPASTSIHTASQAKYLTERDPDKASTYAKGVEELSRPEPIRLSWRISESALGRISSYVVRIWTKTDLSDAREVTVAGNKTEYAFYNALIDTTYYWDVTAQDDEGDATTSKTSSFKTEGQAPRNLYVDGITNVRDLGGWTTVDGGRIRQGLLFRGGQLSINYGTTVVISADGIRTMKEDLGIKGEIDLRESKAAGDENENGGLTATVLGEGVAYYSCSMPWKDSLGEKSLSRIKDIFAILADENNYPLYFHCRIGTDRTGLIAWLVNALCGVSENDLWRDYLFSNFGNIESARTKSKIENLYVKDIKEMPGDTFADQTYNYLKTTLQVPEAYLKAVVRIMKEPAK